MRSLLDLEIDGVGDGARPAAQSAEKAIERLGRLGVPFLERGADDRREIADVLGDEEIVLHEAFDVGLAGARGVAEPFGDRALQIEAQALLGAPGEKMQVAAHRPQELLAARKQRELPMREQAGRDELMGVAHAIDVFGDPEQRVEIAQAPLALLDVGLDEIAQLARALDPRVALGELGGDELARGLGDDFLIEAGAQAVEKRFVAQEEAGFEQGGADRHVGARLFQAFLDRARGVADLLLEIPQHIEHRLDDFLAARGRFARQQEQQIDVGAGREQTSAVAADRHDGDAHVFRPGGVEEAQRSCHGWRG